MLILIDHSIQCIFHNLFLRTKTNFTYSLCEIAKRDTGLQCSFSHPSCKFLVIYLFSISRKKESNTLLMNFCIFFREILERKIGYPHVYIRRIYLRFTERRLMGKVDIVSINSCFIDYFQLFVPPIHGSFKHYIPHTLLVTIIFFFLTNIVAMDQTPSRLARKALPWSLYLQNALRFVILVKKILLRNFSYDDFSHLHQRYSLTKNTYFLFLCILFTISLFTSEHRTLGNIIVFHLFLRWLLLVVSV